ncbi:MAG: hypothetical protein KF768_12650 [Phycisphaeraceae bacterium]|nr:hypothetical protein [Phycisphaeraceae bacterium]
MTARVGERSPESDARWSERSNLILALLLAEWDRLQAASGGGSNSAPASLDRAACSATPVTEGPSTDPSGRPAA